MSRYGGVIMGKAMNGNEKPVLSNNCKEKREQMKEKRRDILISESNRAADSIIEVMSNQNKLLPAGFALITTGYTYALSQAIVNNKENITTEKIIIIFPVFILAFIVYYLEIGSEYYSMGGYKRFVDERINTIWGDPKLLPWETIIAPKRHSDGIRMVFNAIVVIMILGTLWKSYRLASIVYREYNQCLIALSSIVISIVMLCIIWACYRHKHTSFDKTYELLSNKRPLDKNCFSLSNLFKLI